MSNKDLKSTIKRKVGVIALSCMVLMGFLFQPANAVKAETETDEIPIWQREAKSYTAEQWEQIVFGTGTLQRDTYTYGGETIKWELSAYLQTEDGEMKGMEFTTDVLAYSDGSKATRIYYVIYNSPNNALEVYWVPSDIEEGSEEWWMYEGDTHKLIEETPDGIAFIDIFRGEGLSLIGIDTEGAPVKEEKPAVNEGKKQEKEEKDKVSKDTAKEKKEEPVEKEKATSAPKTEDKGKEAASDIQKDITYSVKKGDTLGTIAINYYGNNANRNRLYTYNAAAFKKTGGKLTPGMTISIPRQLGKQTRIEEPVLAKGETLYTVKSGDSLWKISANQYGKGSMFTKIYNRNKDRLAKASAIYVGQKIVIPAK